MDKIYLLRREDGAPEDFWPVSAHRTKEGATAALIELAEERDWTVRPYGPADGPAGPDGYTDELEAFAAHQGDGHAFISDIELED
jgi:hypothetical protein